MKPETRVTVSQVLRWLGGFVGSLGLVGFVARVFDETMFGAFGLAHGAIGLLSPICLLAMFLACVPQRLPMMLAPVFIVVAILMGGMTGTLLGTTALLWFGSSRINQQPRPSEVL